MKSPTLPEFGPINWAIYSPVSGRLLTIGLDSGEFDVSYAAANDLVLEVEGSYSDDAEEKQRPATELRLNFSYCRTQRLWVRPGFALQIFGKFADPKETENELRFGDLANEFRNHTEAPLALIERKDWRKLLRECGIVLTKIPPQIKKSIYVEKYYSDSQGNLIYNELTGFHHRNPEGNCHLDDGFAWSERHTEWIGAAIADSLPEIELKHFFAAMKPKDRLEVARRLKAHTLDVRPLASYRSGLGFEYLGRGSSYPVDIYRGITDGSHHPEEDHEEAFEDAINYLSTLRPGATKDTDLKVLTVLQTVEAGIARSHRLGDTIDGYEFVRAGGSLSIGGSNHGTRLLQLLKMQRTDEKKRKVLQKRWTRIAGKFTRYEAEPIHVLAADFGLCPYPSRVWINEMMQKGREEHRRNIAESLAWRRKQAEAAAARMLILNARREDDVFQVVEHPESKECFTLQVVRDGNVVESYTVCREGTRLFCNRSGCDEKQHYTRREMKAILAALVHKERGQAWLESHNFARLFADIGIAEQTAA